jgi:hypothetical protein
MSAERALRSTLRNMPPRSWPPGTNPLVIQLDEVRRKGVHAFLRPGLRDNLPEIRAHDKRVFPDKSRDDNLYEILHRLLGGATFSGPLSTRDVNAAEALLAFDSPSSIPLATRQKAAAESYGDERITVNVFRQQLEIPLIKSLASAIEGLSPGKIHRRTLSLEKGYVSRPVLEEELQAVLDSGEKLISLVGDAGTGKTTLGRKLAGQIAGNLDELVEISASTQGMLIDDITKVLDNRGVDTSVRDAVIRERFRRLLGSSNGPSVVLLDNVDEPDILQELLPKELRSTVIITSRRALHSKYRGASIRVSNMTSEEAVFMVMSRLPSIGQDDAKRLAEELDGRPLAIDHVCGFLFQDKTLPIQEFYKLLRRDISGLLDEMGDETELTLTAIYRMTIDRLDKNTLRLLDIIVAVGGGEVSQEFLRTVWRGEKLLAFDQEELSLTPLQVKRCIRALEQRYLIEQTQDVNAHPFVRMHFLTRDILYGLRQRQCRVLYSKMLEFAEVIPEQWPTGKTFPIRLTNQVHNLEYLLAVLARSADNGAQYPDLAKLAAFIVRAKIQDGGSPARLTAAKMVYYKYDFMNNSRMTDQERDRRLNDKNALFAELVDYYRMFPKPSLSSDTNISYTDTHAANSITLPGLLLGNEWGADFYHSRSYQYRSDYHRPFRYMKGWRIATAPRASVVRKIALKAELENMLNSAAFHYFCLGTIHFDQSEYRISYHAYKRAYEIWSNLQDCERYIGEICKASARLSDSCRRMGNYAEAEYWRNYTAQLVNRHLQEYGLNEWTADPAVNAAVFRMVCTQIPYFPLPMGKKTKIMDFREKYQQIFGEVGATLADIIATNDETVVSFDTFYHSMCAEAMRETERAHRKMLDLAEKAASWEWHFAERRCLVAATKIEMFMCKRAGDLIPPSPQRFRSLIEAAKLFGELPSPYWRADALLTAWVFGIRTGSISGDDARRLITLCWEAHYDISRLDRMKIAFAAKSDDFNPLWLLAE